jgi:hypothetical protein
VTLGKSIADRFAVVSLVVKDSDGRHAIAWFDRFGEQIVDEATGRAILNVVWARRWISETMH